MLNFTFFFLIFYFYLFILLRIKFLRFKSQIVKMVLDIFGHP